MIDYIETHNGTHFHFLEPIRDEVFIMDISYALSHTVRWGGHCQPCITVAQHCVMVSQMLQRLGNSHMVQMQGLLHDAAEAYIPDIPTPIKPFLKNFQEIEEYINRTIFDAFKVRYPLDPNVKIMDREAMRWEYRDLMRGSDIPLPTGPRPTLVVWDARHSQIEFEDRFFNLQLALDQEEAA